MTEYLAALILIALPLAIFAKRPLDFCAFLICANWLAGWSYNAMMGTYTPWGWLLAIDAICAILIIANRRSRYWPLVMAASFVPMILCHFRYAYGQGNWVQHDYWEGLRFWAFVQLGLLALWGGSHLVSHISSRRVRANSSGHHNFNNQGVEP